MKKILALVALAFIANPLFAGEVRTWTSQDKNTLIAEMVGMKNGKVLLKVETGKVFEYPVSQLIPADQKYIEKNAPMDSGTAAMTIDNMVMEKLKSSYAEIVAEMKEVPSAEGMTVEEKKKRMEELDFLKRMTWPTDRTTDEQFIRRIYLDVAGRIPTYAETLAFLDDRDRNKRAKLIDELLNSEAFVSHFFNYMSDLLRIRDGIGMNNINGLHAHAYVDWTKDQIRNNTPWNEWVYELLTAQGYYWDNPATGYLLTDVGMQLCNLSNTFTVFAGTEITCAQCHDHPFEEVYQSDFFKMAAFFGGVELRGRGASDEKAEVARKKLKEYQDHWKEINKGKERMPRFDQRLQDMLQSYSYFQTDKDENGGATPTSELPHDYKYEDYEPKERLTPGTYFGEIVELEDHPNSRVAFAKWMTSKEHPRFTINIVNRLWKQAFGLAQIEPVFNVPGHLDGQAQNYDLLIYLEQLMKGLDYDLKGFLRILYNTDTYQRQANPYSPTLAQIDQGEYHFPAPVLRRMTAEQIWDSMIALTSAEPEGPKRRVLEEYRSIMNQDWSNISFDQAMKIRDQFGKMGNITAGDEEEMMMMGNRRGGNAMARASELPLPANVGSILYAFGQSDKLLIENANYVGSVPQVMMMLNGNFTNKTMSDPASYLVENARGAKSQSDGVEICFLSILNRRPSSDELQTARNLVNGEDYSDLIWALLNTREFMFIQ